MLSYSLISLLRHLGWFGTSLQVGYGVGGSPPPRSLPEHAAARQRRFTPTKGNGPEACSALFAATPQARHLIMREKAEMLFGHLKRISDWTPAWPHGAKDEFLLTGIAQNWGIGPTDPCTRAHLRHMRRGCSNFASPANAAGADRPLPSAGFFSATHWAWPFEVMAPQRRRWLRSTRLFDELSSPTRSELPPMNADPRGGPATKLRRTLENPIPRVGTAASNATRCHRAGRFTMMAAPVPLQADSRLAY